jgi:hypothetical protein
MVGMGPSYPVGRPKASGCQFCQLTNGGVDWYDGAVTTTERFLFYLLLAYCLSSGVVDWLRYTRGY